MSMGEQERGKKQFQVSSFGFQEKMLGALALIAGGVLRLNEKRARLAVTFQFFKGKTSRQQDRYHDGDGITSLDGDHVFFNA